MLLCTNTYGQQSHRRIRKEVHQQSVRRNKERQAQRYFFPPLQLVRRRTQQAEAARGENTWQPATWDRRTPQNSLPRVAQRRYVHCSFSYVERNTVFYQYTHTIPVALLAGLALLWTMYNALFIRVSYTIQNTRLMKNVESSVARAKIVLVIPFDTLNSSRRNWALALLARRISWCSDTKDTFWY